MTVRAQDVACAPERDSDDIAAALSPPKEAQNAIAALLFAAWGGNLKEVEAKLAAGVSPNVMDANGFTPLIRAAMGGHRQVRVLKELGGRD
ncbi:MAG: ankyrin repeat domain-containing protein [Alphaproteobacteria bacterium]|nr:ankyrin repeat domain-containing protein [Alphaproteobacteria bacterium]